MSCVRKHKYEGGKIELTNKKMSTVLTDVFLMESYVNEKMQATSIDSVTEIKKDFYKAILKKHKVDSASFYSTFNYYQAHPKEFSVLLHLVDSSLSKINAKDTTTVKPLVNVPKNIETISSFKAQEKAMRDQYLKDNDTSKIFRKTIKDRIKKNN